MYRRSQHISTIYCLFRSHAAAGLQKRSDILPSNPTGWSGSYNKVYEQKKRYERLCNLPLLWSIGRLQNKKKKGKEKQNPVNNKIEKRGIGEDGGWGRRNDSHVHRAALSSWPTSSELEPSLRPCAESLHLPLPSLHPCLPSTPNFSFLW